MLRLEEEKLWDASRGSRRLDCSKHFEKVFCNLKLGFRKLLCCIQFSSVRVAVAVAWLIVSVHSGTDDISVQKTFFATNH